jgi:hypothetical protein
MEKRTLEILTFCIKCELFNEKMFGESIITSKGYRKIPKIKEPSIEGIENFKVLEELEVIDPLEGIILQKLLKLLQKQHKKK